MFPNFENMTVDQMLEKQIELKQKVAQAISAGMSPQIVSQMQNMLDQLMIEYKSKVANEAEQLRKERASDEGIDPDEFDILNIGDVE